MDAETISAMNDIVDGLQLAAKGAVKLSKTVKDDEVRAMIEPYIDMAQRVLLKDSDG